LKYTSKTAHECIICCYYNDRIIDFSIVIITIVTYGCLRYALKDLWESEREYVRDLGVVMDTYFKAFDGQLPTDLAGKRDVIFTTFPEIFSFHNE
jgi:hypothetical protein